MINLLINEPMELNEQAVIVITAFYKHGPDFHNYFNEFTKKCDNFETNKDYYSDHQEEIEFNTEKILINYLDKFNLCMDEAVMLEPKLLFNYRVFRDGSELIVFTMSLICLSVLFEDIYDEFAIKKYIECIDFMKEFCPEALAFHNMLEAKND